MSELQYAFDPPPSETLVNALHTRKKLEANILKGFRTFKFNDAGDDIVKKTEMDILDFLIALNLLTRHSNSQKLKRKLQNFTSSSVRAL